MSALRDEILTGPKAADCAPYVVTNDMPKDLDYMAKDQSIADILNQGRAPKIIKCEVGDGLISLALGVPAGPVFLMQLEMLSNMPVKLDEYRFYLPITGPLQQVDAQTQALVVDAAQEFFSDLPPLRFNSLALFAQPAPGTDFVLLDHLEMAR